MDKNGIRLARYWQTVGLMQDLRTAARWRLSSGLQMFTVELCIKVAMRERTDRNRGWSRGGQEKNVIGVSGVFSWQRRRCGGHSKVTKMFRICVFGWPNGFPSLRRARTHRRYFPANCRCSLGSTYAGSFAPEARRRIFPSPFFLLGESCSHDLRKDFPFLSDQSHGRGWLRIELSTLTC